MASGGMVIVGAGQAGTGAALALRQQGWDGPITLLGAEHGEPYERPPLSKAVLTAAEDAAAPTIATGARLAEHGIAFRPGCAATAIDRAGKRVLCADGAAVPYAMLLLATGATPRRLALPGAEHARYLRNVADALGLRERLRAGAHVLVVGGGFIGLEVAASAIARGCRVTVLEAAPRILGRAVPAPIAAHVAARHVAAGVDLRVDVRLAAFGAEGGAAVVTLADGTCITCDCIVVGVGAVPETALAAAGGLAIENGIAVDATLRTSDPDILAAGDCCSFPAPLYGGKRLRLEAWRNAQDQGAHAARTMLGGTAPYDAVPWFWSDQYDETLQVAGLPSEAAVTVERPAPDGGKLFFHLDGDGRLVAASGVGLLSLSKDIRVAEMLIAARARPDPASLAAPGVRLRSLLAA